MVIDFEPGEKILYQLRKHWFAFVGNIIGAVIFALVPLGVLIGLTFIKLPTSLNLQEFFAGDIRYFIFFCYASWLLLIWLTLYLQWTRFYLNVWYLTNKRVIEAKQKGLFNREVSSFHYSKIQDVTVEIEGLIPTFLGFGSVSIETAGERENIILNNAARPQKVKQIINEQLEDFIQQINQYHPKIDSGV